MSIQNVITLLELSLKYIFLPQGKYYEQVYGAARGYTVNLFVANMYMEEFEPEAISNAPHPPRLWLRYMSDIFVIQNAEYNQQLLHHINSINSNMQVTVEVPNNNGSIPFLGTLVTLVPYSILLTSVYRKPTQTNQYLNWDSHHNLSAKYSVFNTLIYRARTIKATTKRRETQRK